MTSDSIAELWRYRELLYFFAWREVKVRYRQAAFGAAWAVIQPLFAMVIFTLLFGKLARVPSEGIPYPIFCYTALLERGAGVEDRTPLIFFVGEAPSPDDNPGITWTRTGWQGGIRTHII